MSRWAIVYDLNSQLINEELGNSGTTKYYNKVRKCLSDNRFSMFLQQSVYVADGATSLVDAIAACNELRKLSNAARYINRVHLFKIEELSDLRPIIAGGRRSQKGAARSVNGAPHQRRRRPALSPATGSSTRSGQKPRRRTVRSTGTRKGGASA